MNWIALALALLAGWYGHTALMYLTPKYRPGTPVRWRYPDQTDGDWNTGIYIKHTAWGFHAVQVTGPSWWHGMLGRHASVRGKELIEDQP